MAAEPPHGCVTEEGLEKRHASDRAFVESKIVAMGRPRLGARPTPAAQLESAAAVMREELQRRHEAERAQLAAFLAAAGPPAESAAILEAAAPGPIPAPPLNTDGAVAAGTTSAGSSSADQAENDATHSRKTKAQRRRVSDIS